MKQKCNLSKWAVILMMFALIWPVSLAAPAEGVPSSGLEEEVAQSYVESFKTLILNTVRDIVDSIREGDGDKPAGKESDSKKPPEPQPSTQEIGPVSDPWG